MGSFLLVGSFCFSGDFDICFEGNKYSILVKVKLVSWLSYYRITNEFIVYWDRLWLSSFKDNRFRIYR